MTAKHRSDPEQATHLDNTASPRASVSDENLIVAVAAYAGYIQLFTIECGR